MFSGIHVSLEINNLPFMFRPPNSNVPVCFSRINDERCDSSDFGLASLGALGLSLGFWSLAASISFTLLRGRLEPRRPVDTVFFPSSLSSFLVLGESTVPLGFRGELELVFLTDPFGFWSFLRLRLRELECSVLGEAEEVSSFTVGA